jgi:uncharacterized membrane protein YesL
MKLWQFSTKAGAGIAKDAPPKTGFALLADVVVRNWWELVQLNLLVLLCCLPLVTIPAALVAAVRICVLMLEDRPVYLGRDFFEAFRQRFWKATALGLAAAVTIGLSGYAAFIFLQAARASIVLALPLTMSAVTTVFLAIAAAYAFVLLAMRDQPMGLLLRRALLGALARPLPALTALAFIALLWVLHVLFYPVSIFMPVLINFSFGMLAVVFGVHQATVRLLAPEGAARSATWAGGSA